MEKPSVKRMVFQMKDHVSEIKNRLYNLDRRLIDLLFFKRSQALVCLNTIISHFRASGVSILYRFCPSRSMAKNYYSVTSLTVISKPAGPGPGLNNLTLAFGAKYSLISFSKDGSGRVKRLSVKIYSMVPLASSFFFHPGAPKRKSFPYLST